VCGPADLASPHEAGFLSFPEPDHSLKNTEMNVKSAIRMLIVEDHAGLASNLLEFFDDKRYILDFASDGLTALHLLATNEYDVIILDVMLPGISGFDVCQRLRKDLHCATPVIIMTSKDQLGDKEDGFTAGADDYLVKPFNLRELQLRVDALYRRKTGFARTSMISIPGIHFDPGTLIVQTANGDKLELSGTAARIFEELIKAYPDYLSYAEIQDRVWGEREVDMNTLRTHVYSLRKLLQDTFRYPMIKTLHARGYRLIAPDMDSNEA
jgi:DNA-binding response OmpR family regulator